MLAHMAEHRHAPSFDEFSQRNELDMDSLASRIIKRDMSPSEVRKLWDANPESWQIAFAGDFPSFYQAVSDIMSRNMASSAAPVTIPGTKLIEDCSLAELFEKHPAAWEKIHIAVYAAACNRQSGKFRCAETG